jgi:hypothetical protein
LKQRNTLDDHCKKIKAKIKENREKFKTQDQEFGFIFRNDLGADDENRVALVSSDQ